MAGTYKVDEKRPHLGGNIIGGDRNSFNPKLWDFLISKYNSQTILDIGCGEGHMVEYCSKKGLICFGVDGLDDNINVAKSKGVDVSVCDFSKEKFVTEKTWDLCWCCEFVEHVDAKCVDNFLDLFKRCKVIAMTYAVPRQRGYHHVNCQPESYWLKKLDDIGYTYDVAPSLEGREIAKQYRKSYFAKTGMIFVKK